MLTAADPKRLKIATFLAFMLIPLSGLLTDIYLPSFPAMSRDLGVAESQIQLTLSCFLLSYGLGQLFVGSILDSLGRYKIGLYALAIAVISSLLIGFSRDIYVICGLRIIQGFSVATIVVSKRALFVDMYSGEKLKNYLSYFTVVWSSGPIIAPFLGGFLEKHFGWQSNFYFLAAYGLLMLVLEMIYSGETLAEKQPFKHRSVLKVYKMMLSNANFILGIFILGLAYSVVMVFSMSGPFIIEHTLHYSAVTIGYCALLLGVSWMIGGLLGKQLINWEYKYKVFAFSVFQLIFIGIMIFSGLFQQNIFTLVGFAFLIHICSGFIFNVYFTAGLMAFPKNAGASGGLLGGAIYILTSILSFVISTSGEINTQIDLGWRYLTMSLLLSIGVIAWNYNRNKELKIFNAKNIQNFEDKNPTSDFG